MASHLEAIVPATEAFSAFFSSWLDRQQAFLEQLVYVMNHDNDDDNYKRQLIRLVLSHYAEYFEEKGRIIWHDVTVVFSPPWLTSFEKTFLWVGGFKPSLAFSQVEVSVSDLTSEQEERLRVLKAENAWEERKLTDALAEVQERTGSLPFISLIKQHGRLINGEVCECAEAMQLQALLMSMARVVQSADNLRRNTTIKVVELLSVNQSLKFLIAVAKYQIGVRASGLQYDVQRQ